MSDPGKLEEFLPFLPASARAGVEHIQAGCELDPCSTCGRRPCSTCGRTAHGYAAVCSSCDGVERKARAASEPLEVLPESHRGARLDSPWLVALVGGDVVARASRAVPASRCLFVGRAGAGKTSLAAAMLAARREPLARWLSAFELGAARARSPLGSEAPVVVEALRARLLVIDEVGAEPPSPSSAIGEVIYQRHAAGRATWITSGQTGAVLSERYGGGIVRRMFEGAELFQLGGAVS